LTVLNQKSDSAVSSVSSDVLSSVALVVLRPRPDSRASSCSIMCAGMDTPPKRPRLNCKAQDSSTAAELDVNIHLSHMHMHIVHLLVTHPFPIGRHLLLQICKRIALRTRWSEYPDIVLNPTDRQSALEGMALDHVDDIAITCEHTSIDEASITA